MTTPVHVLCQQQYAIAASVGVFENTRATGVVVDDLAVPGVDTRVWV